MKAKVLIVDDETDNLRILSNLLKQDYQVIVAKNAEQALLKAKQVEPHLILLDVIMPGKSGFEIIREIRQTPPLENTPVIFITGLHSSDDETLGFELGAVDYIHKPFNPNIVQARVSSQLKIVQQTEELKQLTQELKLASEAKGRFLANMSHEIRTPLTTVIGYAEGILNGDIEPVQQLDAVKMIDDSGKHLLTLINDILDFSKIEAGELNIELIQIDLLKLLQQVRAMADELCKSKSIDLNFTILNSLPTYVFSDPTRLKQVLLNLLSNAIKFTAKGSVDLTIEKNDNQLIFYVKDSGVGIASEKLNNLFTAFNQLDDSTNRKYGGTGLGLSISKSLINKLGGDIKVESTPGVGSLFTASIHLETGGLADLFSQQEFLLDTIQDTDQQNITSTFNGKVLVAEDQPQNRKLFELLLTAMGLEVIAVENGQQALESALTNDYHLILMDIHMPVMNGLESLDLIRGSGMDTPVIALTANVMKHEVEQYIAAGFDDHLAKPIDRDMLIKKISRYCDNNFSTNQIQDISEDSIVLRDKLAKSFNHYISRIKAAQVNHDKVQLTAIAHELKGTASSFGFKHIGCYAAELEVSLTNQYENPQPQIKKLIDLLEKAATD